MYTRMAAAHVLALAFTLGAVSSSRADDESDKLARLIEKIATGDELEAQDATNRLLDLVAGRLADAVGRLSQRPIDQQFRVWKALQRVTGELRLRVFRADLADDDRTLFDDFNRHYPELTRQLFDDDPELRLEALQRIPLEPGTGAGMLIVAKIDDMDGEVIETALRLAMRLKDPVIVRGLRRYITQVMDLIESDVLQAGDEVYVIAFSSFVHRAIQVLGAAEAKDALPEVLRATKYFASRFDVNMWDVGDAIEALGSFGDERAAPFMIAYLDNGEIRRIRSDGIGQTVAQTVGDAALLGLLRIYKQDPKDYGFVSPTAESGAFLGYASAEARTAGRRTFQTWYREHVGQAPTSQPTSQKGE